MSEHAPALRALDNSKEIVREHHTHIEIGKPVDQMISIAEEAER